MSMSSEDLMWTCQSMATMLDAGLSVTRTLRVMEEKAGNRSLRNTFGRIRELVEGGEKLSEAFEKAGSFPTFLTNMIAVAEESGSLDEIMAMAGDFYEAKDRIWKNFLSAMILPIIQYVAAVAIVSGVLYIVNSLMGGRTNLIKHLLIGYGTPVLLYVAYRPLQQHAASARWFQEAILRVPVLRAISRNLALARFSRTMHVMLRAGSSAVATVRYSLEATDNAAFSARFPRVAEQIKSGERFTTALRTTGLFPEDYLTIASVGEESGQLAEKMDWLAENYTREAERSMATGAAVLSKLLWVVVAIFIIINILRFFSMYAGAMSGGGM